MSPKSKGRKRKQSKARGRNEPPSPDMLVARMAQDAIAQLEQFSEALDAEIYVSELLGAWWGARHGEVDAEVVLGERLVAYAARRRHAGAVGLLRVIAVLGTERQRAQAAAAADALVADGVAEPGWVRELGTERVIGACAYGDVFGDQTSVLLVIERAGARHGVVALIDHTAGGTVTEAFVTDEPDETLADLREAAGKPATFFDELTPAAAAALLAPAFQETDAVDAAGFDPELHEAFLPNRALAVARVALLPPSPARTPRPEPMGVAERAAVVDEFLDSAEARDLPAGARGVAELIVEFGSILDPARPLRVGPLVIHRFLDETLNDGPELTEDAIDALPATVRAWALWAGKRAALSEPALAELTDAVDDMLDELEYVDDVEDLDLGDLDDDELLGAGGADIAAVADAYLADLDLNAMAPEELPGVLDRRLFAIPFAGTRIGDEEFPRLSPGDPDDRGMLIEGEHPEYHAALADPNPPTVDGVNPRLHITLHEIVANQLWDDDPPEAWQAAQRLLAGGADRHDVLHAIADVLVRHLHGALTGGAVNIQAYRAELDALGRSEGGSGATVTPLRRRR